MKTLTKIKLINWHGFYDETICINGSTLIMGDNGCGKSTLLDAIYFLLSGGEDNKFNAAANENANRTLTTYMRGKTGTEGNEFLRPESNIITHIALEFFDTATKHPFILGVVLEIQESKNKIGRSFYHIINREISDELFFNETDSGRTVLNHKSLEKKIGKDNINALDYPSDSREKIRKNICSILEVDPKKYYELLPKALAFKPIPEVNDFVYKFLMPEKNTDIEAIRENIHTYNELQATIIDETAKKEALEKIVELGDRYCQLAEEIEILQGYELQKEYDYNTYKYRKAQEEKVRIQQELEQETAKILSYQEQIDNIKEAIYSLEHNEAMLALRDAQKDLEREEEKAKDLKKDEATLNEHILKAQGIADLLDLTINLQKHIKSRDFSALQTSLQKYKDQYDEKFTTLNDSINELHRKIQEIGKTQEELVAEKKSLEQGIHSYRNEVSCLKELIESGIYQSTNETIKATPLCELIDIAEGQEEWRDALEGYLNTRRFDLFVPERYYDQALSIYERYKIEKKIHGVGLVNVAKIKEQDFAPDSLASKITTNSASAQKYVNYLMGDVICVENEQELKQHERAITKTVMVYQNKAARQTKREVYATPYIGTESVRIRLQTVIAQLADVEKELNALNTEKTVQESLRRKTNQSHYDLILNFKNVWSLLDQTTATITSLRSRLNEIRKNTNSLMPKIDVQNQLLNSYIDKKTEAEQKKDDLIKKQTNVENEEKSLISTIETLKPLIEVLENNVLLVNKINEYSSSHSYTISDCKTYLSQLEKDQDKAKGKLPPLMASYIERFAFDAIAELDSLNIFYQEYNLVVSRNLSEHLAKLEEVKQTAVITFQNSYIAEIRKRIIDEKKNIEKLNKILSNKPFGADEEVYQFEIRKSTDKTFGAYYDVFMSNQDYSPADLFTAQLSDKNYTLMQDLFSLLTKENGDDNYIRAYTDYRRFMSYDIKITNKRGEVSYFSKINKEKSGGETQTPFYVIIAASFDQLMQEGYGRRSPGCLVLLDEAFNNMDEAHIDSMMKYFSGLNIQPIIVVPTQRAKTIMPYVSTTIAILKKRNRMIPKEHIR